MTRRRIGVFGGTFDPPHDGHLVVAVNVRFELALDEVLLVVAGQPWQKVDDREVSPAADRLAMVEAAVGEVEGLEPCDLEIRRGGPSYTADTLQELHAQDPEAELLVILGADAAEGLDTWERGEEVRALASIVVVDRPGEEGAAPPPGWQATRVEVPRLEISSTDLRWRVATGRPVDYLVPPAVASCISDRRLYRSGGAGGRSAGPAPRNPSPARPR